MSDDKKSFFDEINDLDGLLESSPGSSDIRDDELRDIMDYLGGENAAGPAVETVDEIVKEYEASVSPEPTAVLDSTTVSDLNSLLHGNTDTLPGAETHVIPDDVRKIYESKPIPPVPETAPAEEGPDQTEEEDKYVARNYRAIHIDRRHKTGCLGGLLYFLFVICLSAVLAFVGWIAANDVLALNKPDHVGTVVIPESAFTEKVDEDGNTYQSADISVVADELKKGGFIDYPILFKVFARFAHADKKIDPGEYELSTSYDFRALVAHMKKSAQYSTDETTLVTIPEGKSLKQTFELLEDAGVCKAKDLWDAAANSEFNYWFISPDSLGDELRLEGFLFPDTYEFYVNSSPNRVLERFLNNFEAKFTDEMREKIEADGRDVREIVIVASLIEMEAANDDERPDIASVIYNRLGSSDYPFLQIDASIQYILPERKERLTYDDLLIDDPYNTYLYKGLTPGPIANPGLASIKAAIEPADTDYFFYALNKNGAHSFFNDYYSFEAFVNSEDFGG
jgi:UPF0755 protein